MHLAAIPIVRHSREGGNPAPSTPIDASESHWIPAFAGMTVGRVRGTTANTLIADTPGDPA
jgi:hypothetical protein